MGGKGEGTGNGVPPCPPPLIVLALTYPVADKTSTLPLKMICLPIA